MDNDEYFKTNKISFFHNTRITTFNNLYRTNASIYKSWMEKHKSSGFKTLRSGDFNKYRISIIDNINYIFEKKEIKKPQKILRL